MTLSSGCSFDSSNVTGSNVLVIKATDLRLFHQMLKAVNFKDDCLNIFGSSNAPGIFKHLEMCYAGYGSPLTVLLKEEGVITTCSIGTQEPDSILDFNFIDSASVSKIIMKSSFLKDCLAGSDASSSILEIHISPDQPYLRISTYGNAMTFQTECSHDSELVDVFQVSRTQTNRYKMSLIKTCLKALNVSSNVSLRMDERGILCFQFMIQVDENISFVEYYCSPDEDEDEQL